MDIHIYLIKKNDSITKCLGLLKSFFTGLVFLSTLTSANMLSCISMNHQKCIIRPQIVNVNDDDPVFFLIVLKQVNAVVVATISKIHSQNCVQSSVKN